MIRFLTSIVIGCLAGLAAHVSWYQLRPFTEEHTLDDQLQWMRGELNLTEAQFAQIKSIHEASSPHLQTLALEVERNHETLAAFEAARMEEGQIDFLKFAEFVERRREVDAVCEDSTRQLIDATLAILEPSQRERYVEWLGPTGRSMAVGMPN